MTVVPPLAFPSSRVLAGWWKLLQPLTPTRFWVGHLFFQRVEALAQFLTTQPLDPLHRFLLQALRLETERDHPEPVLQRLQQRLHFPLPILQQLLHQLAGLGLIQPEEAHGFSLAPLGDQALAQGEYPRVKTERRLFSFLEHLDEAGNRQAEPHFLGLREERGQTWHVKAETTFDLAWLNAAHQESATWKQTFGFPENIQSIAHPGSQVEDWKKVMVLRPERFVVVLAALPAGEVKAFAAQPEGWQLGKHPLFTLPAASPLDWLTPTPAEADLRKAWKALGEAHRLTPEEIETGQIEVVGHDLAVQLSELLSKRLKWKAEDWILVGEGPIRQAVRVVRG